MPHYLIENYKHLEPIIDVHVKRKSKVKPVNLVSELAVMTGAPAVIVCHLLKNLGHDSIEIEKLITKLMLFYKCTVE